MTNIFSVVFHSVSFVDCATANHVFVVPEEKWHEWVTKVLMFAVEAEFVKFAIKRVQMSHPWVQNQRPFCGAVTCRDVWKNTKDLARPFKNHYAILDSLHGRRFLPHSFPFSVNLLAPGLFFLILTYPVYKMWIIQKPNKLELWKKLHFEEKRTESIHNV